MEMEGKALRERGCKVTANADQLREAARLREEAAAVDRRVQESWERSDTDGFLSQWAGNLTAQLARAKADLLEAGGVATFPGLYDRVTGVRVRARLVDVPAYGAYNGETVSKWVVLDSRDNAVHWVPAFKRGPRSKLFQLGFEERDETAPAQAVMKGRGRGLSGTAWVATVRTDRGIPDGAVPFDQLGRGR
jgi:hypothetical protein